MISSILPRRRAGAADSNAPKSAGTSASVGKSVYDRIRADILSLDLAPASDIDEKTLATTYGMSRTPIREALIRLSGDGLIVFSASRGARVSPLIVPNLPRYLEAFDLTLRALARVAAVRALPDDKSKLETSIERLEGAVAALDYLDYEKVVHVADAEVGVLRAVSRCAHNGYISESFEKLLLQGQRMLRLPYAYNPSGADTVEEYSNARMQLIQNLTASITSHKGDSAEDAMRRLHLSLTRRLTAYMAENLAANVSIQGPATGSDDAKPRTDRKIRADPTARSSRKTKQGS